MCQIPTSIPCTCQQAVPALRLLERGDQGCAAAAREVLQAAKGAVREELLAETAAAAAAVLPMGDLGAAEPAALPPSAAPAERVQVRFLWVLIQVNRLAAAVSRCLACAGTLLAQPGLHACSTVSRLLLGFSRLHCEAGAVPGVRRGTGAASRTRAAKCAA